MVTKKMPEVLSVLGITAALVTVMVLGGDGGGRAEGDKNGDY